jgi:hypothetical protein
MGGAVAAQALLLECCTIAIGHKTPAVKRNGARTAVRIPSGPLAMVHRKHPPRTITSQTKEKQSGEWPGGEEARGGASYLVELAAEALGLGFQVAEASLKGLAAGTRDGSHTP